MVRTLLSKLAPGPIPLYYQLEQALADRITGGEFGRDGCLPSEEQIGREFGVSRITVRKALDALLAQGMIERRRGVGSFVVERPAGVHAIHLSGSLDDFLISAYQLSPRVISLGKVLASAEIANAFDLKEGAEMLRLELLSSSREGPLAHAEFFFRSEVGAVLAAEDIVGNEPVVRLIERKLGRAVTRATQVIEADVASGRSVELLKLPEGTPLLRARRSYFTQDGELIELAQLRYHPERYRYEVELRARPRAI